MLPRLLQFDGVEFHLAPAATGTPDAVIARGQSISLPRGDFNRVYLLAASTEGDRTGTFRVGDRTTTLTIQNWGGFIGQWDTRSWKPEPAFVEEHGTQVPLRKNWAVSAHLATWPSVEYRGSPTWSPRYPEDYLGLEPGYIKRAELAWYCDHYHTPQGLNDPYAYSYLFGYLIDLPPHATSLILPNDDRIRILAISVARGEPEARPAQPLYDTLENDDDHPGDNATATR
jgi:alpha-mannosidase